MGDLTNRSLQPFVSPAPKPPSVPSLVSDVFLVNPANRNFITGKARVRSQSPRIGCIAAFIVPFLLVGVATIVWAVSGLYQWNTLNLSGVQTTADITGKQVTHNLDGDSYSISYHFADTQGDHTHAQSVSAGTYERAQTGAKVNVIYVPDQPELVALAGTNDAPWFPVGFSLLWNIFVWGIGVALFGNIWSNRLLERKGRVLTGAITGSSGAVDGDGDFTLKLDYTFQSPRSNRVIKGSARQMRNDLKQGTLPPSGSPLAILYRKDRHHKPL